MLKTPPTIRRLGPGDEPILVLLARDDADFDLAEREAARPPLDDAAARAYLADANLLHLVAERDGVVVGHLYAHLLRKFAGDPAELILYEIGVRSAHRRTGVGRALVQTMEAWMHDNHIREWWVLADNPDAVEFYRACGFAISQPPPVYMLRSVERPSEV
jgi:GNAT superfamily N-acetyltransferase